MLLQGIEVQSVATPDGGEPRERLRIIDLCSQRHDAKAGIR